MFDKKKKVCGFDEQRRLVSQAKMIGNSTL